MPQFLKAFDFLARFFLNENRNNERGIFWTFFARFARSGKKQADVSHGINDTSACFFGLTLFGLGDAAQQREH